MHICHVITRLIIGGAQENTLLSCEGLRELGHRVTLIAGPTLGPEGSLVQRARRGGYEYVELPDLVRAVNPWRDVRARRYLRFEFERLRPDVIHTHSSKAGILGRLAAADARILGPDRRRRRPVVVHTIHGMSFNRTQSWWVRSLFARLERRAARVTDRIVTVADAMIEQCIAARIAPRDRFLTIYSGMETDDFDPDSYDRDEVRAEWFNPRDSQARLGPSVAPAQGVDIENRDRIVVGAVARLFRKKGYEQLIPVMQRAAARDRRLHFVWVGDGAQRPEFESELTRLGLKERTTLAGLVPPSAIPRLLAGFDILVHASQWEGLPRAVVQALLMRVPVVAFDIDGTPEVVIDRSTGRLVKLNDLDAFSDAIAELARDPQTRARYGASGRDLCLSRFDSRVMVRRLAALYESLAS